MQKPRTRGSFTWLFIALGVVSFGALGVVLILPQWVTRPAGNSPDTSQTPKSRDSITSIRETKESQGATRVKAEALLRTVLEQQARLENDGVKIWGNEKGASGYPAALAIVADGNSHLDGGRYSQAAESYSETLSLLNQIEKSRPNRLQNALRRGSKALDVLDDGAAKTQFEVALALDPGNSAATLGLKRAQNLKQVVERVQQGRTYEAQGDLSRAKKEYAAAIAIDGNYQPAREHLRRLDDLVAEGTYRSAIIAASTALERKDYDQSQASLDQAAKLRPNAPEVKNLSSRLREAKQVSALEETRISALRHEEGARWNEALKAYERALAVDPNATFALLGKKRAGKYVQLNREIDYFLDKPDRLQSPDPMAQAQKLIDASDGMPKLGPNLRGKLERLSVLIGEYRTPRPVVLRSDQFTEVTVYRVGRFGRFSERRMKLRPGEYTAVGSREGYRDVRVRFRVPTSGEETVIVIRCEEEI